MEQMVCREEKIEEGQDTCASCFQPARDWLRSKWDLKLQLRMFSSKCEFFKSRFTCQACKSHLLKIFKKLDK